MCRGCDGGLGWYRGWMSVGLYGADDWCAFLQPCGCLKFNRLGELDGESVRTKLTFCSSSHRCHHHRQLLSSTYYPNDLTTHSFDIIRLFVIASLPILCLVPFDLICFLLSLAHPASTQKAEFSDTNEENETRDQTNRSLRLKVSIAKRRRQRISARWVVCLVVGVGGPFGFGVVLRFGSGFDLGWP